MYSTESRQLNRAARSSPRGAYFFSPCIARANPPFNYNPWGQDKLMDDVRWKYGIPPASNANFAWIQHMIHHLAPNGKIGLVLANGALSSQSGGEGEIRKKIIEDDLIEGIIAMPPQLFYSVTIPATLWFISKGKKQKGKTVFIDARKMGHMVDRKHRDFTEEDIQKLANTFEAFQNGTLEDEKGFCSVATIQDIAKQDYVLTPGRYVGIEEQVDDGEPFEEKMTRLTSELSDMFERSHELEDEIRRNMKYKLSDICEYAKGKIKVSALDENTYISTENMLPNKGAITKAASLPTQEQTQAFMKNDVLVSNIRPYFKKIWYATFDGGCSNDVLVFRAKDGVSSRFLHYVLADDTFFDYSMATSKGTKMPRGDKKAIMEYEVPELLYEDQCKIAGVLEVIDEKIELNTDINKNLLEQAQSIFTQEFLMFDRIPDGWQESSLLGIADYLNGLAMQKYRPKDDEQGLPVLKIKELRQGSCDFNSELCSPSIKPEYIVHDGDVIFSWSGSLLVDLWCGGTCGLNQHLFKVTSSTYDKWFYYAWTNHHLQKFAAIAADMATTMGHIKREELSKAEVLIPSQSDYDRIGGLLAPLYDLVIANRIENRKLASLRDELLPQLMSGQLDVSEVSL